MNVKLFKLAKMILNLGSQDTEKGTLHYEGELAEGSEVFIEVDGELQPAPDGEYETENKVIVVSGGKVESIKDKEVPAAPETPENSETPETPENPENLEEQTPEGTEPDDKDAKIAELEKQIEELNAVIVEKDNLIGELRKQLEEKSGEAEQLKSQLKESTDISAEEKLKAQEKKVKPWFKPEV